MNKLDKNFRNCMVCADILLILFTLCLCVIGLSFYDPELRKMILLLVNEIDVKVVISFIGMTTLILLIRGIRKQTID